LNRLKARHFKKHIIVGLVAGRNQMRTTLIILAGKTNLYGKHKADPGLDGYENIS
jgi:hypothetical protein